MATAAASRIWAKPVRAFFPARGSVTAIIYGEAPGPRGADKSGIPFFGDRAGILVYKALIEAGRCRLTHDIDGVRWDGTALVEAGVWPTLIGTALSNAYNICPTDDGEHFRAPTKEEMARPANIRRVRNELDKARKRGLRTVIVLGRVADWLLGIKLGLRDQGELAYHQITHPSPLGLMSMKRQAGPGAKMADMQREWMRRFEKMLESR